MPSPHDDTSALLEGDRIPHAPGAPVRDYILTDYEPVCDPVGRLHSASVLRHFLRHHGLDAAWSVVERCQALLGPDETVWGVKYASGGRVGIELYFYEIPERPPPLGPKTVSHLVEGLADIIEIRSRLDESFDYFMCSLELDADALSGKTPPGFRIYARGNRRVEGYDGISYWVRDAELVQENYYLFYLAENESREAMTRLAQSVRAGGPKAQARLAPKWLRDCYTICFATKRLTDALYFSRVETPRLSRFLDAYMPGPTADMIRAHQDEFAHLRWDVGYDFATSATDAATPSVYKAGFYGYA